MNRLRQLRLEKNISQASLGKMFGYKDRAVGFWESGRIDMNTDIILKLADFFNVSTDYLLGRTYIRNPKEYLEKHLSQYELTSQEYDEIIGGLINNCQFDLPTSTDINFTKKQKIHSDLFTVYVSYQKSSPVYQEEDFAPEKAKKEQEPINASFIELLKSLDKNKIIVDGSSNIDEDKLNVAFSSGYDGLNETNKNIIMEHIQFLTSQQNRNKKKD